MAGACRESANCPNLQTITRSTSPWNYFCLTEEIQTLNVNWIKIIDEILILLLPAEDIGEQVSTTIHRF
jgi:hypothetical protein